MTAKLRLAIDARSAQYHAGGVPRYSADLIAALGRYQAQFEFQFVLDAKLATDHLQLPPASVTLPTRSSLNSPTRDLWEELVLPRMLDTAGAQVFHGLSYVVPMRPTRFAKVATFHDAIVFTEHDARGKVSKARLRMLLQLIARAADRIVTDSDYSAGEIERYLPPARGKITRIWAGITETFFSPPAAATVQDVLQRAAAPDGYVLYYGGFRAYKNVDRLLRAFRHVANACPHQLVLAGPIQSIPDACHKLIADLQLTNRVTLFGYAEDEELKALLNRCSAFVFPSAIEGFGLPVAEALACGAPVLCSDKGSLPEIAGDAALYLEELAPEAIARCIIAVLGNAELQDALRSRGPLRAKRFTWENAGAAFAELYQDVHERKARARKAGYGSAK